MGGNPCRCFVVESSSIDYFVVVEGQRCRVGQQLLLGRSRSERLVSGTISLASYVGYTFIVQRSIVPPLARSSYHVYILFLTNLTHNLFHTLKNALFNSLLNNYSWFTPVHDLDFIRGIPSMVSLHNRTVCIISVTRSFCL